MAQIVIGHGTDGAVVLESSRLNRHGLIAGATGTGKTVTLQSLAEQVAAAGSAVFVTDIKGDLSGIAMPGRSEKWIIQRYADAQVPYEARANDVVFWDVEGRKGHPARLTISELGPLLLARLLDLSDVQTGVLQVVFRVADEQGLLLLDMADLRAMLGYVGEHAAEISRAYGAVSGVSLAGIQRALLALEAEGGLDLFGEPALQVADLLRRAEDGRGMIHVLDAVTLMQRPRVYGVFLLYLLSELFEDLPEVGDLDVPKLCLFFDEAHLLFKDTPKPLMEKIEQVVRLIRSKGVGVYFVSQQPSDIPEVVLAQLGNRIQHALRAATPQGQRDIQVAARTMAVNPDFRTEDILPRLGVGEALVSVLDKQGVPQPVQRVAVLPPVSRVGSLNEVERAEVIRQSVLRGQYETSIDRESAFEILKMRFKSDENILHASESTISRQKTGDFESEFSKSGKAFVVSAAKQLGRLLVREMVRGLMGGRKR